jgi:uncharacterized iron-regulated protein
VPVTISLTHLKRKCTALFFLLLAINWSGCASLPSRYVDLSNNQTLDLETILGRLDEADVVFVGEFHADRKSQGLQLEVIQYLYQQGKPLALAMEMFPYERQPALDLWVRGDLSEQEFKRIFYESWRVPFRHYRPIFEYARQQRIPLFGVNDDDDLVNRVAKSGIGILPTELLDMLRYDTCEDAPDYAVALGLAGKRFYHQKGLPHLCDAQRLRDAIMAYHIFTILQSGRRPVVVMTGAAHAGKTAVPAILQRHKSVRTVVLLPEQFPVLVRKKPLSYQADYVWR